MADQGVTLLETLLDGLSGKDVRRRVFLGDAIAAKCRVYRSKQDLAGAVGIQLGRESLTVMPKRLRRDGREKLVMTAVLSVLLA